MNYSKSEIPLTRKGISKVFLVYFLKQNHKTTQLNSIDNEFPEGSLDECSVNSLLDRLTSDGRFSNWDILAGSQSIGKALEDEGFLALPGPSFPKAGIKNFQNWLNLLTLGILF